MSPGRFFEVLLMLMLWLSGTISAVASEAPRDPLVVTDCSYGNVYQFEPAGCATSLENASEKPLSLRIVPVQPGNSSEPDQLTLAPHAHAELKLHVLTDNIAGTVTWAYRIEGAAKDPYFVHASGFVSSIIDVGHPQISFGTLDPAALPATRSIALTSAIDSTLRITKILSSDAMLHARIGADTKSLDVEIQPDAPGGPFDHFVKLALANAEQKQVWVEVTGNITSNIGPPTNPYWVGEIAREPKLTLTVPLIDREGSDFSIGKIASNEFAATYDQAPCDPVRAGCRNLLIHVSETQPAGLFKSPIDVELLDRKKHITVVVWGVLGEQRKSGEAAAPPAITKIPVLNPESEDFVSVPPPLKVQADPPGTGPLLKWTVGQQAGVYGYQVLRGESRDGPFQLMEPHVIAMLDNGKGPVAYRWRDTSAVKGRTYWYYIAVLYASGDRKPLSEPHETIAK